MLGCFHHSFRRNLTDIFNQYVFTQLLSVVITTLTARRVRYGNRNFVYYETHAFRQYIISSVSFFVFLLEVWKRNTFQEINSLIPAVMWQWISDFISVGYVLCIMQFSIGLLFWFGCSFSQTHTLRFHHYMSTPVPPQKLKLHKRVAVANKCWISNIVH